MRKCENFSWEQFCGRATFLSIQKMEAGTNTSDRCSLVSSHTVILSIFFRHYMGDFVSGLSSKDAISLLTEYVCRLFKKLVCFFIVQFTICFQVQCMNYMTLGALMGWSASEDTVQTSLEGNKSYRSSSWRSRSMSENCGSRGQPVLKKKKKIPTSGH